jgi:membrane protein required for colicin V production
VSWIDYIIVGVLGLSVLIGLWRGLISEVLALATWVAAFWVAWTFGPAVSAHFEHSIDVPSIRLVVGYGLCFITVLVLGALVRFVIHRLVESTGLSGTDRLLGMIFGFARGVLLVTLMVFLVSFTAFTRDPWWKQSVLLPQFQAAAAWLGERLPAGVREHLHPDALQDRLRALPVPLPGSLQPAPGSTASLPVPSPATAAIPSHSATINSSR